MLSHRSMIATAVVGLIFPLFMGLSGCAMNGSSEYSGEGTAEIERTGFFERGLFIAFNDFNASKPYQNHRKIVRLPTIEQPHYFQVRIRDSQFYAQTYYSQGYHWGAENTHPLLDATVSFKLGIPDGKTIVDRNVTLSQLPLTSPESGVVDFLIYAYQPRSDHPLQESLSRHQVLQIEFKFFPPPSTESEDRVPAQLILEAGPQKALEQF